MKAKTCTKMKGAFLCHSTSSTAILCSHDYRSIVVPSTRTPLGTAGYIRLRRQRAIPAPFPEKNDREKMPREAAFSTASSLDNLFQVVVMRVSIHCQGCAAKLKKHISKMEGVTSFSIDLESKRVTVMGHVSPSGVLESISKVKKAEFWPH